MFISDQKTRLKILPFPNFSRIRSRFGGAEWDKLAHLDSKSGALILWNLKYWFSSLYASDRDRINMLAYNDFAYIRPILEDDRF